jgi:hypothetical protein
MLKKELMIPGSKIEVLPVIKDGLPKYGPSDTEPHILPYLRIWGRLGSHEVYSGEILTVIEKPKKRFTSRINSAIVETSNGIQGQVFWCELRISCKHI